MGESGEGADREAGCGLERERAAERQSFVFACLSVLGHWLVQVIRTEIINNNDNMNSDNSSVTSCGCLRFQ